MNAEMEALAQRAVACKAWRWMPGMRAIGSRYGDARVVASGFDGAFFVFKEQRGVEGYRDPRDGDSDDIPDLADPATLGCLLALVREAWGDRCCHVWHSRQVDGWVWVVDGQESQVYGGRLTYPTEAEALVAALEAAP